MCESNPGSSNPVLRELNLSGFLAPSLRLLSRLLFVLVLAGTLSEFGFGCGFEAPGYEKAHGPGNFLHWHQSHNDSEPGVEVGLKLNFSAVCLIMNNMFLFNILCDYFIIICLLA